MWDVGDHLLGAVICAQLAATDERHWIRWSVLTIVFVITGFIKDCQVHGVL